MKVVQLPKRDIRGVVELLERVLADAKEGKIESVVAIAMLADGREFEIYRSDSANGLEFIGAMRYAEAGIIESIRATEA